MLKMIIVDDEYIICEGLKTLIDWQSAGVEVVGVADNGAAALELALKKQPDIILSDIAMPHFSGLQMIETMRRNGLATEVIFISAYSSFDYAQEALRYGAFDYLLKPIQENLVLETVRRCAEKIRDSRKAAPAISAVESERRALIAQRLKSGGRTEEDKALLQDAAGTEDCTHVAAVGIWGSPQPSQDAVEQCFSAFRAWPVPMGESLTLWLLFAKADGFLLMKQNLQTLQEGEHGAFCMTCSGAEPLEGAFEALFAQVSFGYVAAAAKGRSLILFGDCEREAEEAFVDFEQGCAALLELVKAAEAENVGKALYRFFLVMLKSGMVYDMALVRLQCIELVNRILHDPAVYHLQDYFDSPLKTLTAQKSIASCETLDEVFVATKNLLANFSACMEAVQKKSSKRLVSLAVQYIEEHFQRDISLSQVAQALFVSPSYLSKLFSAEMQTTFSHFLQAHRIEVAKKLLHTTHLKIYEVANQSGYSDVAHFSKSFKQVTGVSPNQYRNR